MKLNKIFSYKFSIVFYSKALLVLIVSNFAFLDYNIEICQDVIFCSKNIILFLGAFFLLILNLLFIFSFSRDYIFNRGNIIITENSLKMTNCFFVPCEYSGIAIDQKNVEYDKKSNLLTFKVEGVTFKRVINLEMLQNDEKEQFVIAFFDMLKKSYRL